MSIINRMLQELDRREETSDPDATAVLRQVRSVTPPRKDREWFWRILATLMLAAVGWVAWVAYQLQSPPALVTAEGLKAASGASRKPVPPAAPVKPAALPPVAAQKPAAGPEPAKPAALPAETFKLAQAIDTPIREQARKAAPKSGEKPAAAPRPAAPVKSRLETASASKLELDVPPARVLPPPAPRVEKRDRIRSAADRAESEFRRAAALLNQGRVGEAEDGFAAALAVDPSHETSRQALVALHLERRQIDAARRLLQEGLAINPANAQFVVALGRVFAERREYAKALEVLGGARPEAQSGAEYHALLGNVLQRLARHAEAAEAFQAALRGAPQNGSAWVGLGISLDALGKRAEAAEAFRRALASGPIGAELKNFAEQRLRALQ